VLLAVRETLRTSFRPINVAKRAAVNSTPPVRTDQPLRDVEAAAIALGKTEHHLLSPPRAAMVLVHKYPTRYSS
jgi:hypothetical protein